MKNMLFINFTEHYATDNGEKVKLLDYATQTHLKGMSE
jgi:hypothetical protein